MARCTFNKLAIIPTPDCIVQLNVFERSLVKLYNVHDLHYSIAAWRDYKHRAKQSELTAALNGRIPYLPLYDTSNATFLPENLLNTDSLVLLVAGQPTKSNKIWTSVVDLHKVHTA